MRWKIQTEQQRRILKQKMSMLMLKYHSQEEKGWSLLLTHSHTLVTHTPLTYTCHSYTPHIHLSLIHPSHALVTHTPLTYTCHSYTPHIHLSLIHPSHTLVTHTPLTYTYREEVEKQRAAESYRRLHEAGKTEEAMRDLARLAIIRQQREEAAKKREAERKGEWSVYIILVHELSALTCSIGNLNVGRFSNLKNVCSFT